MTEDKNTNACTVIIPAYNPTATLVSLVEALSAVADFSIVVVDDGSDTPEAISTLSSLAKRAITVLRHPTNLGKGAALKTAFVHCLKTGTAAVVTADADGQHCVDDIVKVASVARRQNFQNVVLGVRTFKTEIPLRSKFGNVLTRWLFRLRTGLSISDTQTGLRCISADILKELAQLPGNRYEFESYMLLFIAQKKIPVVEVPIKTIYIDNNATSHFRPIADSMRIYWILFRDIIVAIASFLIDIGLFSGFISLGLGIIESTYAARIFSGIFNFFGCKHWVFRQHASRSLAPEAIKYILLAIGVALVSAHAVQGIANIAATDLTLIKIFVDGSLYFLSFLVRRYFVFPAPKRST